VGVLVSPEFFVGHKTIPETLTNCENDAIIGWNDTNASRYEILGLGEKFLERIALTTDTTFEIDKLVNGNLYYAITPMHGSFRSVRSRTIDYTRSPVGCYLKSFLPRQIVTDTVILDLVLGTASGVRSVVFEKLSGGEYHPIKKISRPDGNVIVFYDPDPVPGSNFYRVTINLTNGIVVQSNDEEVIFTRANDFFIYPNPVKPEESFFAVVNDGIVTIKVYDAMGRLVRSFTEDGQVKEIQHKLPSGLYIVTVSSLGRAITTRLIVR